MNSDFPSAYVSVPSYASDSTGPMRMTDRMLQFFAYEHLKPELQGTSKMFSMLASYVEQTLPENPERTACLRKLLEAKDCAVRAKLYREPE